MDKEEILQLIKETIKQSLRINVVVGAPSDADVMVKVTLLLDNEEFDFDSDRG